MKKVKLVLILFLAVIFICSNKNQEEVIKLEKNKAAYSQAPLNTYVFMGEAHTYSVNEYFTEQKGKHYKSL